MQHKQAIVLHREAESAETFAGGVVALTETYKVTIPDAQQLYASATPAGLASVSDKCKFEYLFKTPPACGCIRSYRRM